MIEHWLAAAAGRRTASVTPVSVIRTATANASNNVTFAAAATAGQLVLIVSLRPSSTVLNTAAAGFVEIFNEIAGGVTSCMSAFYKIAGGSEPSTYVMDAGALARHIGYVLSGVNGTPVGNVSTNSSSSGATSLDCAGSAIGVSPGSILIAAHSRSSASAARSFSNSFVDILTVGGNRLSTANRIYAASAAAQNSAASWAGSETALRGALIEIKAA